MKYPMALVTFLGLATLVGACSDGGASPAPINNTGGSGGSGGSGGKGGKGGSSGKGGSAGKGGSSSEGGSGGKGGSGIDVVGGSSGSGGTGAGASCGGITKKAELAALDLFLMIDQSGSMDSATASGQSKWNAVKQAIVGFIKNPKSEQLGVGLQYFPLAEPGVPYQCTKDSDCKGHGPCEKPTVRACTNATQIDEFCESDADCAKYGPGGSCEVLGLCFPTKQFVCFPGVAECSGGGTCKALEVGVCEKKQVACLADLADPCLDPDTNKDYGPCSLVSPTCSGYDSCDVSAYATPEVEIAALPGAAAKLEASLNKHGPTTATPTGPALQGALDHAQQWSKDHPDHKVVVVLATDGLPTKCTPLEIGDIAQIAAQSAPGILSFVIGVFGPDDIDQGAPQNLDQIASKGGSDKAYLVSTDDDVTQKFLAALDEIRGKVLACDYKVPTDTEVQYDKVNVEFTPAAGSPATVAYVGSSAKCDPAKGGWYYDVDPTTGGKPTKIIVCPSTCQTFQGDTGGQVDVRLGCDTVTEIN